jgi:predicted transposase YdaD
VSASDKLFYWVFQLAPDRILQLQSDLPPDTTYSFSAPVLKEREYRLDGLFWPREQRPDRPVVILEAQMAPDPGFLRRLYAESARLLQQDNSIQYWRVVVLCPQRDMGFGDPTAVVEFIERRVQWLELQPALGDPAAPPLLRSLALLLESEDKLPETAAQIRTAVAGTPDAAGTIDVIAAILMTRFSGRPLPEICAMGGITLEDFSQSAAFREIFGQGRQEGRQEGRQQGEVELTLLMLRRRCGELSREQQAQVSQLSLPQLEALAEALLDFTGMADLKAWLAAPHP